MKAFLTTKVFLKLKNANENEQLCHPEVPEAHHDDTKMQGGTSNGRGKRKIAARIIGALAGVTSGSTRRAGFAYAHTAQPLTNDTQSFVRQSPKFGFTLAEVLITLGIIGIVAAMTMPTLIQNYKRNVLETRISKFASVYQQAVRMAEAEHGELQYWEILREPSGDEITNSGEDYLKYYNKY